ncbi:N-acetyl-beta-D-galactosaminidase [Aureococcus anophagefferens]|nr:N-acetyl-beta-D-galactosaminidase [Aureococcus anophagefferens]
MVDPVDASASRDERRRLKKRLLRELDGEKDHLRKTLDVVEAAAGAAPAGAAGPRAWRPASASASLGRSAPPAATPKPRAPP